MKKDFQQALQEYYDTPGSMKVRAYHEAAHCVSYFVTCVERVTYPSISCLSIDPTENYSGFFQSRTFFDECGFADSKRMFPKQTRQKVERHVMDNVAGNAMETIIGDEFDATHLDDDDIEVMVECDLFIGDSEEELNARDTVKALQWLSLWHYDSELSLNDFQEMLHEGGEVFYTLMNDYNGLFRKSCQELELYRTYVDEIAGLLIEHNTVDESFLIPIYERLERFIMIQENILTIRKELDGLLLPQGERGNA